MKTELTRTFGVQQGQCEKSIVTSTYIKEILNKKLNDAPLALRKTEQVNLHHHSQLFRLRWLRWGLGVLRTFCLGWP
jgi:hypothetical protein